jgi:hypothetical protein
MVASSSRPLGPSNGFADLVDPEDGSVVHDGPSAMYGGEWRIERVTVTDDLIRVFCRSTRARVFGRLSSGEDVTGPRLLHA